MQFSFTYTEDDVKIYLDMVASGKLHFPGMVTGVVSLDQCVEKVFDGDRKGPAQGAHRSQSVRRPQTCLQSILWPCPPSGLGT